MREGHGLCAARDKEFLLAIVWGGDDSANGASEAYTVMMPMGIKNPRKRPMVSEPFDRKIPSSLPPLTPEMEGQVIETMFMEINTVFGLTLDIHPVIDRAADPSPSPGSGRTVLVGASHVTRIANTLANEQDQVIPLCTPGWTPSKSNLQSSLEYIKELKLGKKDKVIFDPWANSAYMGTDATGLPIPAMKIGKGGHYHILGHLQAAPRQVFRVKLDSARGVIDACGEATVILLAPFPRYVSGGCCKEAGHVTNLNTSDLHSEILKAVEHSVAAATALEMPNVKIFTYFDCFGSNKEPFPLLTSGDETIWATDAVHLSEAGYRNVAAALIGMDASPPAERRERLDSLVPGPPPAKKQRVVVPPPLWAAGISAPLPTSRGRGRGRGPERGRGGLGRYEGPTHSWMSHQYAQKYSRGGARGSFMGGRGRGRGRG